MSRGLFLVFEGIDACGKSTQARRVAAAHGALFTFEPGDTPLGTDLRKWLLADPTPMKPETEALLMLADRSHHVASVLAPAIAQGRDVVSDRYFASTLAYQGYGRGVDLADLRAATDLAIGSCLPDLTVLIDLDVATASERKVRDARDRFETSDREFHQRVRDGYLAMAEQYGEAWWVVDGSSSEDDVAKAIEERLAGLAWARA
ncbi:MAG: dTMP kinase [Acidimicrobiales bacterium]